jgi:hypothetical protein
MSKAEFALYEPIIRWLTSLLNSRFPRSTISVHDTHSITLSTMIYRSGLQKRFPGYQAFDIKVDITGFISTKTRVDLALVEVKEREVRLLDVGQILGYSRVAKPYLSLILSPQGLSSPLKSILRTYGRYDILEYDAEKRIRIARWEEQRGEIDLRTVLPKGDLLL